MESVAEVSTSLAAISTKTELTRSSQKNSNLGLLFSLSLSTRSNSFPCSFTFVATVDKKCSSSSVSSFGQIRRGGDREREVDRRRFDEEG